jgi:hypothetical protein
VAWVETLRDSDPDIIAIDGRPHGAAMRGSRAAARRIWCRPGRAGNVWGWHSGQPTSNPTRSRPFPCSCNGSNGPAPRQKP